jgi:hypothetical protein
LLPRGQKISDLKAIESRFDSKSVIRTKNENNFQKQSKKLEEKIKKCIDIAIGRRYDIN